MFIVENQFDYDGGIPDLDRFSSKAMKISGRSHVRVDEIKGDHREIVYP